MAQLYTTTVPIIKVPSSSCTTSKLGCTKIVLFGLVVEKAGSLASDFALGVRKSKIEALFWTKIRASGS